MSRDEREESPDAAARNYSTINMSAGGSHREAAMDNSVSASPPSADVHEPQDYSCGTEYEDGVSISGAAKTPPQSFTPRSLFVGLVIGTLITFSNTYFGLQTGWISTMAMPSALIGFSVFKALSKHLSFPFTPIENVLIQTVAGAVGTMPLGCGFVGVIPALEFLLKDGDDGPSGGDGVGEGGPLKLSFWSLATWSLGVCMFGVVFAVPLRKEVIIREKLRFPSGTASALMLKVLHGSSNEEKNRGRSVRVRATEREVRGRVFDLPREAEARAALVTKASDVEGDVNRRRDWKSKMHLLIAAFAFSGLYTLFSYFVPQIRDIPIFGASLAVNWLWTLNLSPAYVGQGIIMGPSTCMHMLFGAVLGWGVLSPLAKYHGWAPGPVNDWEDGSKGWIVWISLAIMLADSLVSLSWLVMKPLLGFLPQLRSAKWQSRIRNWMDRGQGKANHHDYVNYSLLNQEPEDSMERTSQLGHSRNILGTVGYDGIGDEDDAPPSQLISTKTVAILLPLTLILNVICMHIVFGDIMSPFLSSLATLLAVLLSIMGVRALGETDLNPVSGISKLTQLIFSLATPASRFSRRTALVTNLLAGAVSESGALQAGDMMQDLKTGHLLGASPKAQFYGQFIGSLFGAVLSTAVYKMYVSVYEIPGPMFQTPTAYVWIFTARLVTGQGLPAMAWQAAVIAGAVFVAITILRIFATPCRHLIPGGIAVAVGMFNVPSFTLARAIGGLVAWWWTWKDTKSLRDALVDLNPFSAAPAPSKPAQLTSPSQYPAPLSLASSSNDADMNLIGSSATETTSLAGNLVSASRSNTVGGTNNKPSLEEAEADAAASTVVILASGLILGEGIVSIVNLLLASGSVPHL